MNDFRTPTDDERLHRLLDDAVADVEPREALQSIRARTSASERSRAPWLWGAGAAFVATAATVTAIAVMGGEAGTPDAREPDFAATPSVSATVDSGIPSDQPTPSETTSTEAPPVQEATVPVYYVGDTNHGPRLFREFQVTPVVDGEPLAAAQAAVSGDPLDPDYRSAWPDGTRVADVATDLDVVKVNLTTTDGDAGRLRERPGGMSEAEASLAIEQLIYTVQAVYQDSQIPVLLVLDGLRTDMVLGVPTSEPLARGDELSTLSLVMVTTPEQGAKVSGMFVAEGIASSFEATVPWQILRGDRVVMEGFSTAEGWMDRLYPWRSDPIDVSALEPGEYTFVARTDDPSGGAEGNGPYEDTKQITVVE